MADAVDITSSSPGSIEICQSQDDLSETSSVYETPPSDASSSATSLENVTAGNLFEIVSSQNKDSAKMKNGFGEYILLEESKETDSTPSNGHIQVSAQNGKEDRPVSSNQAVKESDKKINKAIGSCEERDAQAKADNQIKAAEKHLEHWNESKVSSMKEDTAAVEASGNNQGPEAGYESTAKECGMLVSNTQPVTTQFNLIQQVKANSLPQADTGMNKTRETVSVISSEGSVNISSRSQNHDIADPNAAPVYRTMNTDGDIISTPPLASHQSQLASSKGVAASTKWVLFEEDGSEKPTSQVTSERKIASGDGEGWVKFNISPHLYRHAMSPQLTGNSSVPSFDPTSDDHQSDITMSVLSSGGSLSDHVSHEYLPLANSPPLSSDTSILSQPGSVPAIANWVRFESPPQNVIQPKSNPVPSQMGSQGPKPQHPSGNTQIKAWVSFDEPDRSTPTSPVLSHTSSGPNDEETAEQQQQRQQMQQALAVQQQQQIQSRQQQQQLQPPVMQSMYQQNVHPLIMGTPLQNHTVSITPIPSSSPVQPSTSTPLPGNPFREEMLRQQARTGSPFNPFQAGGPAQTPSTPGGTVSAMWGESPITPRTVDAMWEKFEESSATAMAVNANVQVQNGHKQIVQPVKEVSVPVSVHVASSQQGATTPNNKAQEFQSHSAAEQSPASTCASSTTPAQSTPVSAQPFQRHTKASKQVTIRASGKRPQFTQNQQDDVVIDDTPFVDEFPREKCGLSEGWPMMLRCPDKKKVVDSRFWRPVHVKLLEGNMIQLFDRNNLSEPFREMPLQCNYEFVDKKRQAYDTLGKIHTVKLMYGYVSFSEKRCNSTRIDFVKLVSTRPLLKLGSTDYNTFRSFISTVLEYKMRLSSFRDRGISYKQDAIGVMVSDDYRCRIGSNGELEKQSTVVTLNVLAFLSDMPDCSISLNDVQVKGLEVVSRRDIIPNKTIHWIKLENVELHKCANTNVFVESRLIEFQPLDGSRFCLMKFHTRPRQNMELPLYVKVTVAGEGTFLELRADLVLPARPGRQDPSQIICTDIMIRIPIPESWIKYFRCEKRLGFHSVKSVHGKPDRIKKGSLNPRLLETSIGSAKYEHAYKAIVWRIAKLPDRATVFSASHILMCRLHLISHREVPRTPVGDVEVEFTMLQTTASRTTVRSLSIASDKPAEKCIRYTAHYEYFVEMENKIILQVLDEDEGAPQCTQQ